MSRGDTALWVFGSVHGLQHAEDVFVVVLGEGFPAGEGVAGCDVHVCAVGAELAEAGAAKVLHQRVEQGDEALEGVPGAEGVEAAEEHGRVGGGLGDEGFLLAPEDVCDDVEGEQAEDDDTVHVAPLLDGGREKLAELGDVAGHAVDELFQVPVLKALDEVVPGGCGGGIVDEPQGGGDAFPRAHSFIERGLLGVAVVDDLHGCIVVCMHLVWGYDRNRAVLLQQGRCKERAASLICRP